jgi:hypothetical protein
MRLGPLCSMVQSGKLVIHENCNLHSETWKKLAKRRILTPKVKNLEWHKVSL